MKNADNILDEVLGVADPVEQELGLNKMLTPTVPRPSKTLRMLMQTMSIKEKTFTIL